MNFNLRRTEEPDVNMTSLIDVVLLLLIFFMLSTKFIDEGRLKVRLPEAGLEPDASTVAKSVEITVTQEGSYRINGRTLVNNSAQTLASALKKEAGTDPGVPITIRADARAMHQSVVTAMDVVAKQGYSQINIATVHDGQEGD